MIRQGTLSAIKPVADTLSNKGVNLAALGNTPLHVLMNHSFPYTDSLVSDNPVDVLLATTALATDSPTGNHSDVMDVYVKQVGDAIVSHCDFTRNTVLPMVAAAYQEVRDSVETEGAIPYSVEQVWLHQAVTSTAVAEFIDRYEGCTNLVAPVAVGHGERSEDELLALLSTGSSSYDAVVADLLSRLSVSAIYQRYFVTCEGLSCVMENGVKSIRFNATPVLANELLIVHLLARGLYDNPAQGANVSLLEYRNGVSGYVEATGCALNLILKNWDRHTKNGQLIVRDLVAPPSGEKVIYVHGPVYQQFLEKGGDAEAIIGAVVGDQRQLKYLPQFVEQLSALKTAYNNWVSRQDRSRLANAGGLLKTAANEAIAKAINALTEEQNICGCKADDMHVRAVTAISGVPEADFLKSPYHVIRKVMCESMFPTSNCLRILCLMDEECEKHGHEDLRVAAYHAVKTLLVEHVLSQIAKVA